MENHIAVFCLHAGKMKSLSFFILWQSKAKKLLLLSKAMHITNFSVGWLHSNIGGEKSSWSEETFSLLRQIEKKI